MSFGTKDYKIKGVSLLLVTKFCPYLQVSGRCGHREVLFLVLLWHQIQVSNQNHLLNLGWIHRYHHHVQNHNMLKKKKNSIIKNIPFFYNFYHLIKNYMYTISNTQHLYCLVILIQKITKNGSVLLPAMRFWCDSVWSKFPERICFSFMQGRISWKEEIFGKIFWNQEISWKTHLCFNSLITYSVTFITGYNCFFM